MFKVLDQLKTRDGKIPYEFLDVSYQNSTFHDYTLESFKEKYMSIYGEDGIVKNLQRYETMPNSRIIHENQICYKVVESFSSPKTKLGKPKVNTYILCPLCDPFKNSHLKPSFTSKIRDGQRVAVDQNQPQFYDTLHSQYEHHLSQVHGVMRFGAAANPFVGLSLTQGKVNAETPVYELNCICPYSLPSAYPCLAEHRLKVLDRNGNPFKAYFRHVHLQHYNLSSKNPDFVYKPEISDVNGNVYLNIFIPLSVQKFQSSLRHLKDCCAFTDRAPILCKDQDLLSLVASYVSTTPKKESTLNDPYSQTPSLKRKRSLSPTITIEDLRNFDSMKRIKPSKNPCVNRNDGKIFTDTKVEETGSTHSVQLLGDKYLAKELMKGHRQRFFGYKHPSAEQNQKEVQRAMESLREYAGIDFFPFSSFRVKRPSKCFD